MSFDPVMVESLARQWIKVFNKAPWITSIATGILVALIGGGIFYADRVDKQKREAIRLENLDYQTQIKQLNQTETNIKQLLNFVELQKSNIRESQDVVAALKKEKETLKPIVDADKAAVEALFRAQEDRTRTSIWRERWIGFGFGVIASLVASFIGFVIRLSIRVKKRNVTVNSQS